MADSACRMREAQPISKAAISRAKQASPTGDRCLIENVPNEWAVEVAHVFARERSKEGKRMRSLEWAWGMRKNTLNLDTRGNIFFLSPTMHALYKREQWALLPAENVVNRFFSTAGPGSQSTLVLDRNEFPVFSETVFHYTILPLSPTMSKSAITRQTEGEGLSAKDVFKTHRYPFHTLPLLASHVRPEFVLLHLSELLQSREEEPYIKRLLETVPLLHQIWRLVLMWFGTELPPDARDDPTFVTKAPQVGSYLGLENVDLGVDEGSGSDESESEDETGQGSSDGDSTSTPLRRIKYRTTVICAPPAPCVPKRRHLEDGEESFGVQRKRARNGNDEPEDSNRVATSSSGWSADDISNWARECSASLAATSNAAVP